MSWNTSIVFLINNINVKMSQLWTIIAVVACADFVLGASLALPTSANCGDQALLICTSTKCNAGYRFTRKGSIIYNNVGPIDGNEPGKYSAVVISTIQVQLTITNIQLSDATTYACTCGFEDLSAVKTLLYECKATTLRSTITPEKKLNVTVDRLYPMPSSIVTSLTSDFTQLPGNYTCVLSPTLTSHYRCTWVSTASFKDGNHGYTMTVTTGTNAASMPGSFIIVTPTSPKISNVETHSNNSQVLRGVQGTTLTIRCMSSGGIPVPTLAWYRDSTSTSPLVQSKISNYVQQTDGTHNVSLTHIFTPRREDDLKTFLCRVFYPGATNEASPNPSPATALLYLALKPDITEVMQTGESVSGGSMTLRCISANGRPAPSITWSYKNQTFTPTNTSSHDSTSDTYTVESVLEWHVNSEDNGQIVKCRVLHITLSEPLTETINVTVKFGPSFGSTTISGNLATPATGSNLIRLNCTSGSSNPASNITWYNGSDVISNVIGYKTWFGDNNGVITFSNLTIPPTRYMDGNRITCRSNNSYGSDSKYVDLDILYPPLIQPLLNITSTEGEPNVSLTCLASSKPPANFSWLKENKVLSNGTGTITDNSFNYVLTRVDRTNAGSYICQAGNNVGSSDLKIMYLIVKHPPAVTVSTTYSLTSLTYKVTCKAEGYPESYTFQDWVQIWPGYGPIATIRFTGVTLNLTGATYEWSGVYECGASNGVSVYGTDVKFMKGNATVVIKAPPVLTDPTSDGTLVPVAGRVGHDAITEIKYWSNVAGSNVRCYKHVGGSRSSLSSCSVTEMDTEVTLPVHNHVVKETGTLAIIKIHISSQEDMTAYDVVVSNSVMGETVLGIVIVPKGPPEAPSFKGNVSIVPGSVVLTVVPGFHGGCNQTLVVQINTDLTTWINKTSVYIGLDNRPIDVILVRLRENTLHHVRVFAYNTEGRSYNFSTVMNFTTAKDPPTTPSPAALIGVTVGTTCALLVVAAVLVVLCRNRKAGWIFSKKTDERSPAQDSDNTGSVVECAMYVSTGNVQPVTTKCDVYSTPQKRERTDPSANVYAVVSKTKKGKDKVADSTTEDSKGLYAAPMKVRGGKKMEKPGKPSQGLPEIPQLAETTFDATKKSPFNRYPRSTKNVNEDGLLYADLEFDRTAKNGVIHGLEDATVYVDIDITKTAEPLPDSDM